MFQRYIRASIQEALLDTSVILITGARRTGKSTLAETITDQIFTFDDASLREAAINDPEGFILGLMQQHTNQLLVLDEVQLVPDIFRAIKKIVDEHKNPGMFLLTGSANLLNWEKMPESMVGRAEYTHLYPLSLGEISQQQSGWVDQLFAGTSVSTAFTAEASPSVCEQHIYRGGYPQAFAREQDSRRHKWFQSYLSGVIERDIRLLGDVQHPLQLFKILQLVALRCGSTINQVNLAMDAGLSRPTLIKYLGYLELTFLIEQLPPWYRNLNKRLVKTPKIYLNDSGLLNYLIQLNGQAMGSVIEQYVFSELKKLISFSHTQPLLYFYRTQNGVEVDFILENRAGKIIGIEVKSAHQVSNNDFKGLRSLRGDVGDDFIAGIIFYRGKELVSFGNLMYAVPINRIL
jgi:predicted AAA+ superfamily ATPase